MPMKISDSSVTYRWSSLVMTRGQRVEYAFSDKSRPSATEIVVSRYARRPPTRATSHDSV